MENKKIDLQCCVAQCDKPLDQNYWNAQWESRATGWDVGHASPAITEYLQQYSNKNAAILIPGCGNAYEAEWLIKNGFTDITLIDIAPKAVEILRQKFANEPSVKVLCEDFFTHHGHYDLIIEQTFFCAIPPAMRKDHAVRTASLLNENGRIIGVLFDRTFEQQGPPFGGCPCEYGPIFEPHFHIKTMEECYNSIAPRANTELFINLVKRVDN